MLKLCFDVYCLYTVCILCCILFVYPFVYCLYTLWYTVCILHCIPCLYCAYTVPILWGQPLRASEPETISMISLVMAAWRALL